MYNLFLKKGGLILMCPCTSVRDVVKNLIGFYVELLVKDIFRNIDKMSMV